MFRSLKYCNFDKLYEYSSIINGEKTLEIKNVSVSSEKSGLLKLSFLGAGLTGKTTMDATMRENLLFDCIEFEKSLNSRDDYFDCIEHETDIDLTTIPQSSIIRFQDCINIPQEFDSIQLMEQFKPMLLSKSNQNMEPDTHALLESAMEKDSIKIPIKVNLENIIAFGKLNSKYLIVDYTELEDFESDEVIVLAKVNSHKNGKTVIYDPLKDFIKISRGMRRSGNMSTLPAELSKIYIDGEALSLEIIAIYQ